VKPPATGAYSPSLQEWQWLLEQQEQTALGVQIVMASLTELKATLAEAKAAMEKSAAAEQTQTSTLNTLMGLVTGLSGAVDTLIQMVADLRAGLSAEEQAVVDEAMADAAALLASAASAANRTAGQDTALTSHAHALSDLAARAQDAAEPPPTP